MLGKPKVLVVDDDRNQQEKYALYVEHLMDSAVELVQVYDIPTARETFDQQRNEFAAIVMDACVPGREPNTQDLVRYMLEQGFTGPIIAASKDPRYRKTLVECGCTHESAKDDVFNNAVNGTIALALGLESVGEPL